MAEIQDPTVEPNAEPHPAYIRVKEGHPRFNLLVVLVLVAMFIVIALIEAQRLSL
ncbi:MAG: hypothetical protein ACR2MY_09735 [Candidatus Dormibacteria bacterium]